MQSVGHPLIKVVLFPNLDKFIKLVQTVDDPNAASCVDFRGGSSQGEYLLVTEKGYNMLEKVCMSRTKFLETAVYLILVNGALFFRFIVS